MAVAVVLKSGTVKVASPELVEPFEASKVEGSVTIAPGKPMEVSASFGGEGRSLEVHSTIDPAVGRKLSLVGQDWPIHVRQSGVEAKGRFAGNLEAKQAAGRWSVKGDAALASVEAAGPALQGDRLALDRVAATCDVEQSAGGWTLRKLDLSSPVASLQGRGTIPAVDGTPTRVDGKVDLAALAKMLPNAMRLRDNLTLDRGSAAIRLDVTSTGGVDRFEMVAGLDDLAANEAGREVKPRQPVYLSAKASRTASKVAVESLEVKAAGVDVTARGDLEAGVKLAGTVDLVALMAQVRDFLDPGNLDLSGHARVAADYKHIKDSYKGRFAVELKDLKVTGPTAEPIARDSARLDGWAIGPAKPDGLPSDWQQARLDLNAGDVKLDVQASTTGPDLVVVAAFEMAVASPVPGRFDAKAKVRKLGTAFEVDELIAGITPTDPQAAPGVVAVAVRGKFDRASGEGAFGPIPGQAVGAFGLGEDGAKLSGVGLAGVPLKVDAALVGDLGSLDRLLATWHGSPAKGLGGTWSTRALVTRSVAGRIEVDGKLDVPDLTTSSTARGPVSMAIKAGYDPEADRLDLPSIMLGSQYGRVGVVGGLSDLKGKRFFDVKATVEPDWSTIDPIVASSAGPTAKVRATVRTVHAAGMLKADSTAQLLDQVFGEVGLDIASARASGVTLGPTPVTLKFGRGFARFDPIQTTMNGGPVAIVADLALDAEGGVWMRLGSLKVDGAAINKEVSDALLAYVAPVMAKSSQVSGKVTVAIDRAFVPITATGPLAMDGAMAFQDVLFTPGPLATELNSLTGQAMHDIRLNESMLIKVVDGRVQQHGLTIPVGGNGLKVAIDGSVGFDETLDLQATVPLTPKALGLAAIPGQDAATGPTVMLPIRGTMSKPAVDRKALSVALRDAAKAFGEKRLKSEAGRLIDRIAGPNQSSGEPRSKPAGRNPLGDLEGLGREILDPKKP